MKRKSFTLVELMVVIAIIVILAAIAIPAYINMTRRANKAQVASNLGVLATGLGTYYTDWGKYPISLTGVNVATETEVFSKEFLGTGEVNNGGDYYLSPSTLKNLRNPFYPGIEEKGIMYVSNAEGSHYCLFAKISETEGITAFVPFNVLEVYAEGVPEEGSYLYRTDSASNLNSSSWGALTGDPEKYPGAMALTVLVNPPGAGTVTLDPSGGVYLVNTPVTLTESPAAGSSFVNWTGDASETNSFITVTMTANKTVTANFEVSTYALTYTAGTGGTISGNLSQIVNYGASGTQVTAEPGIGYHFLSWNDSSIINPRTDVSVTANVTVTANFAVDYFTLIYTAGANGTILGETPQTVNYGASGSEVTAEPGTGYHFVTWSDTITSNPRIDTNITSDLAVTATFAINQYTVTFDKNGGGTEAIPTSRTADYNTSLGALPIAPTKIGSTFVGWNTIVGGTGTTFAETTPVVASITVYAQWTINSYTVTFDKNGGDADASPTSRTTNYNTTVVLPTAPTKTGYTFASWNTVAGGGGTTFTGSTPVTTGITVYAKWTINSYTVTFDSQGGTSVASQQVNYEALAIKPTDPTYTGHTFVNWYRESACVTLWDFTTFVTIRDRTLYAKWTLDIINISAAGVTGFVAPVKGAVPIGVGALTANAATYTKTSLVWAPTDNPYLPATIYTATVKLTSASGYKFPVGGLTPTVNTGTPVAGTVGGGDVSGNILTFNVTFPITAGLVIGESYGGGKVAYIDGTGKHGLIAATGNQSVGIFWAIGAYWETLVPGGTSTAIGSGAANTAKIIAQNGAGVNYAAGLARAYNGGSYNDWYLPSKDELNQLYINRDAIGGFAANYYCSSSECLADGAWFQYFLVGQPVNYYYKYHTYSVRAVRAF